MTRSTRTLLIVAGAVLTGALITVGVVWFQRNFHQVEHTLYLPPSGEAAYNPLYALGKTLQADGVHVDVRQRLALDAHPLKPTDTLLLFNDPRVLSSSQLDDVLDWVVEGGHLIVRTPSPESGDDTYVELLDELGVVPTDQAACEALRVAGQESHLEFCRGRRFRLHDVEPVLSWGDLKAGYVFARLAYGDGHVDVVADFDTLVNRGGDALADLTVAPEGGLRDVPHQALAQQLLAPNYGRGTVHLVYAAQMPSLLRTLLVRGWMVWAPLLAALLLWLWARMQRFGPPLPTPALERRSLLEHVRASGDHLYRYGRGVLLYQAVRQAFLMRLRRRDPVAAALAGDAQVEMIARRFALPADTIRTALALPSRHERAQLRARISTLIELRNRL